MNGRLRSLPERAHLPQTQSCTISSSKRPVAAAFKLNLERLSINMAGHGHATSNRFPATQPPLSQDTGNFSALTVRGDGHLDGDYQTITCQPAHQNFSLEELRLNDYAHGRGLISPVWQPGYVSPGFGSSHGLLTALVCIIWGKGSWLALTFGRFPARLAQGMHPVAHQLSWLWTSDRRA